MQIFGKINSKGIFLEKLETNPAKYLPEFEEDLDQEIIQIDLIIFCAKHYIYLKKMVLSVEEESSSHKTTNQNFKN